MTTWFRVYRAVEFRLTSPAAAIDEEHRLALVGEEIPQIFVPSPNDSCRCCSSGTPGVVTNDAPVVIGTDPQGASTRYHFAARSSRSRS